MQLPVFGVTTEGIQGNDRTQNECLIPHFKTDERFAVRLPRNSAVFNGGCFSEHFSKRKIRCGYWHGAAESGTRVASESG